MYRVMIVDDEEPVLDSFAFILKKDVKDFILCGKARSGMEAIALVPETKPDVVFMDIQMSGIDGIETIMQIQKSFPNIIYILATAYERFDIAQKAIPLGVFSYLVKPVSKKVLIDELEKVKRHLESRKEKSSQLAHNVKVLKKSMDDETNRLLSNLAWQSPSMEEWQSFSAMHSLNTEKAQVYIIKTDGNISDQLRNEIYSKLTDRIQYKNKCFSLKLAGRLIVLFPESNDLKYLDNNLKSLLGEFSNYKIDIGKGDLCHYSLLSASYLKASEELHSGLIKRNVKASDESDRIRKISKSFLSPDSLVSQELFEGYWLDVFNKYDFDIAKGKMVALFTVITEELANYSISSGNTEIYPAEEIMPLKTIKEWRDWSSGVLKRLQGFLESYRAVSYPKPLSIALDFIRENYSNPIQLSDVAEKCRVTTSYLSRLFSDHLNTSFIDFLNRYKLNIAMKLLKDENQSVKEVSYLVGYQDPNYFSRIFKKYMNMTPSEYIKRRL